MRERRQLVKALLERKPSKHLRFSADFDGDLQSILQSACRMKLEGVMAKQADAPYVSRRTPTWLKLKCQQRQEFVVGGWRAAANARKPEKGGSQPGKSRPGESGPCESEASEPASANALKPGHTVLLRLLACAPPVLTVEVEPVEGAGLFESLGIQLNGRIRGVAASAAAFGRVQEDAIKIGDEQQESTTKNTDKMAEALNKSKEKLAEFSKI